MLCCDHEKSPMLQRLHTVCARYFSNVGQSSPHLSFWALRTNAQTKERENL